MLQYNPFFGIVLIVNGEHRVIIQNFLVPVSVPVIPEGHVCPRFVAVVEFPDPLAHLLEQHIFVVLRDEALFLRSELILGFCCLQFAEWVGVLIQNLVFVVDFCPLTSLLLSKENFSHFHSVFTRELMAIFALLLPQHQLDLVSVFHLREKQVLLKSLRNFFRQGVVFLKIISLDTRGVVHRHFLQEQLSQLVTVLLVNLFVHFIVFLGFFGVPLRFGLEVVLAKALPWHYIDIL